MIAPSQLDLALDSTAINGCEQGLVVHSLLPRLERFDVLPDGWKPDRSWGSPEHGWEPICNGKSMMNGGRKGLLKVEKPTVNDSLTVAPATIRTEPKPETVELTSDEARAYAQATNDLARAKFKEKLLQELMVDLMVCKIEGWSITDYISDLKTLIDETASSILHNSKAQEGVSLS
jgi:hypothetical protein